MADHLAAGRFPRRVLTEQLYGVELFGQFDDHGISPLPFGFIAGRICPGNRHMVTATHFPGHDLSDTAEHLVSQRVAALIVDRLEMVQIEEKQRRGRAGLLEVGECLFQPALESTSIEQPRTGRALPPSAATPLAGDAR